MQTETPIDCIIIGYNDVDFDQFAARQRATRDSWGAYHEVQTNSVLVDGQRITFMDLLNRAVTRASGIDRGLNVFESPSLAVCYLASYLRRRGFRAETVNFFNTGRDRLAAYLAGSPRSVAITTTFYIDPEPIKEIVEFVRGHAPDTAIIVGGPHIYNTFADYANDREALDYILASIGADIYINDSQGEHALSQVVGELAKGANGRLGRVANLAYRKGANFRQTLRMVETNDVDAEAVDWSLFDSESITPMTYLRTARSCPFSCSFCQFPVFAGPHVVNALDNVENQLRYLHEAGSTDIVFIDDTFNVPLPRFKQLLELMIRNQFNFRWVSFLRCSNIDEPAIDLMAESGCAGVFLGIESGDQTILNYMNKKVKPERYRWGIDQLKQRGIATYASLICGFPGETEQSVINTTEFIEESGPTFFNVQLYYHDISAPIHRRAEEFGIRGSGYGWSHNTMDWKEAIEWTKYMCRNIHNSAFISLYGFSMWGISYLLSKGITMAEVQGFGKATRGMLFASLADRDLDGEACVEQLAEVFAQTHQRGPEYIIDRRFWHQRRQQLPVTQVDLCTPTPSARLGLGTSELVVAADTSRNLEALAIRHRTTAANVILALFKLLLFQLTKQTWIPVGLQTRSSIAPICCHLTDEMEFEDLLEAVVAAADEALDHQHYNDTEMTPSNVIFAYRNVVGEVTTAGSFDLRLLLARMPSRGFELALEYERALFTAEQASQMLAHLDHFAHLVAQPVAA